MDPGVPPSPPPPYEEFLYGRPAEPASTTVPQLTTYNTLHDYVQVGCGIPDHNSVMSDSLTLSLSCLFSLEIWLRKA